MSLLFLPLKAAVRGCLLVVMMILDYNYRMHTYLRYA